MPARLARLVTASGALLVASVALVAQQILVHPAQPAEANWKTVLPERL